MLHLHPGMQFRWNNVGLLVQIMERYLYLRCVKLKKKKKLKCVSVYLYKCAWKLSGQLYKKS